MMCPACLTENDPDAQVCFSCGHALTPPIRRGSLMAGRYEILDLLGRGGMGTVYRARDRVLGDKVAVKVLRSDLSHRPEMIRRFGSEMGVARTVRHPNVCRIYAAGEEQGRLYLSMELLEGSDLKTLLRTAKHGLEPEHAFELSLQVASGLAALHEAGIVHRDVKPPNVMLDKKGIAHLMDFDIAKQHLAEGTDAATATGQVLGTPEYMSPEYARGDRVDFRSDVYSLGVLIFELFTGEVPFRGETPLATVLKHLNDPPPLEGPRAERLPPSLLPVLRKALAKDPDERFSTTRGLITALGVARNAFAERPAPRPVEGPPLPVLLEALNPIDGTIRMPAMKVVRSDPSASRAIPVLIDALDKPPGEAPDPNSVTAPHLMPLPPGAATDPVALLIRALKSEDHADRARAARVLGGIGPDAAHAIPVLLEALRDSAPSVRDDAARALERMGPTAQAALAAAVRDPDPIVRRIAAEALGRILKRKRGRAEG
jgi:serine/threonine protein kinase